MIKVVDIIHLTSGIGSKVAAAMSWDELNQQNELNHPCIMVKMRKSISCRHGTTEGSENSDFWWPQDAPRRAEGLQHGVGALPPGDGARGKGPTSSSSHPASYCSDDAFVPVFRPDPSAPSASASAAAAAVDRVRSLFRSVDVPLFRDALLSPGSEDLGFTEVDYDGDLSAICWDCLEIEDADDEPDPPLVVGSPAAEDFEWEEVASPSGAGGGGEPPEPEWEVLADDVPPPPDAEEGFVYTSHRGGVAEVLVAAGGDGLFLKNKPPAARSAVESLPSAVVAAGEEWDECAVCKDGVAAGQRVKRLPCSHRYHDECIVPWLQVRNSCPLCRFELPTDDPEYETWKAGQTVAV